MPTPPTPPTPPADVARAQADQLIRLLNAAHGAPVASLETDDGGSSWYVRVARHNPATRDDVVVSVNVITETETSGPLPGGVLVVFVIEAWLLHQWAVGPDGGAPFVRVRTHSARGAMLAIGYYVPPPDSPMHPAYVARAAPAAAPSPPPPVVGG